VADAKSTDIDGRRFETCGFSTDESPAREQRSESLRVAAAECASCHNGPVRNGTVVSSIVALGAESGYWQIAVFL
jgi:mono/diheme cytochrome c family protein